MRATPLISACISSGNHLSLRATARFLRRAFLAALARDT